jgi:hypothetical protein
MINDDTIGKGMTLKTSRMARKEGDFSSGIVDTTQDTSLLRRDSTHII